MFLYHLKRIWQLTKKHSRAYVHDIHWHFNHVTFYAKQMTKYYKTHPPKAKDHKYWADLPEDPKVFPFNKEKADAALYEVSKWIREDNKPSGK